MFRIWITAYRPFLIFYNKSVASRFCGVEVPSLSNVFLGRNEELKELHTNLQKNKTVFVTGIAGIGKSELVRQYARKYRNEYSNIIYLTYENTLEYTIAHMYLKYALPEKQLFDTHFHILQALDENSLIIIDNYNTLPEESRLLRKFVNHRFKTIFTTRMNIKGVPTLEVREIQDMDTLLALFKHYYKYKPKEKDTVQSIIQEIHAHTLTVELAARTLQAGSISPQNILVQLIENGLQTQDEEEVTITSQTAKTSVKNRA